MKKSKLIKKNQIMILYQYFLLDEDDKQFTNFSKLNISIKDNTSTTSNYQQNLTWFDDFRRKKYGILTLIGSNLKSGWKIKRIPAFEKAIIAGVVYAIQNHGDGILGRRQLFLLVNQVMNFSKKYLEKEKCGYINKLIDLIGKAQMRKQFSTMDAREKVEDLTF